ncbi:MAG TPA: hypothetical protein VLK65_04395 [Vicinamibacteria bacterium]|nr:hypothetical protein [Vicinamibacteria bacterium]
MATRSFRTRCWESYPGCPGSATGCVAIWLLVLPDVFERTWGIAAQPFWPRATAAIRAEVPGFLFLADVYWDLEWTLQQEGFDYTYDKTLYDRLERGGAREIRGHFLAGLDYQDHLVRFLENHDEPRAAATFPEHDVHRAAAVLTFFSPGLRFFHQGQRDGRKVRIAVHLGRGPSEPVDEAVRGFYERLLARLRDDAFRDGSWLLLECRSAWEGNASSDAFIAFSWSGPGDRRRLVAVNYAKHRNQCYVDMPWNDLKGRSWRLADQVGDDVYDRPGDELQERGLYLDMPAWGSHVFHRGTARRDGRKGEPMSGKSLAGSDEREKMYETGTVLTRELRVRYPLSEGRMVLKTNLDRDRDHEVVRLRQRDLLHFPARGEAPLPLLQAVSAHRRGDPMGGRNQRARADDAPEHPGRLPLFFRLGEGYFLSSHRARFDDPRPAARRPGLRSSRLP